MINFKAYSKKGSINNSVITDSNLLDKNLLDSKLQISETRINNNPTRSASLNQRILFQKNQIQELNKLRRTDIKKMIRFLYNIQVPIRLIKKIIRKFNYFKVIKLYQIFNKKRNITYNLLTQAGIIEPSSKEILNKKINAFIQKRKNENKHKSQFQIKKTLNNLNTLQKSFFALKSENSTISSNQIARIQKAPIGLFASPNTIMNSDYNSIKNLNIDQNPPIQYNFKNKVGAIKFFIESLSKFKADIANNQFLIYNFNRANKFTTYSFDEAIKLLKISFLRMGCFISKPNIQVVYNPSVNIQRHNPFMIDNQKNRSLQTDKISDLINFWSKNKLATLPENKNTSLIFKTNLNNYYKKINIQLFYYVRSENTLENYFTQISSKYNLIQNLMMIILKSEKSFDTQEISATSSLQTRGDYNLEIKNKMIEYLSEMKTKIRNEQKMIIKQNILRKYTKQFQYLGDQLSILFNAEVELELIRLYKPYHNSHILVQNLSVESYINRFVKLVSNLFHKISFIQNLSAKKNNSNSIKNESHKISQVLDEINYLSLKSTGKELDTKINYSFPSYLTGMNIKLGGRTFKQRIVPRMTQKRIQKGSLNKSKVLFFDRARFTGKTKRGAYSFTVKMGHAF